MMLDLLLAYGDLLELPMASTDGDVRRVFLGAPAFVRRSSGSCVLVGVRPEASPLLDDELSRYIHYEGHVRAVRSPDAVKEIVSSGGLVEIGSAQWLRPPRMTAASDLLADYLMRLDAAGPSGDIADIKLIDSSSPVTYYTGRWRRPLPGDTGHFVSRRPQAFGADLWCFAAFLGGQAVRLIDLPVVPSVAPGADEAWRVQAGLDALAEHPQRFRLRPGANPDGVVMDLFSPLPSWAQRRLDIVGTPLMRSSGALFSYGIHLGEVDEEVAFLRDMLWMSPIESPR